MARVLGGADVKFSQSWSKLRRCSTAGVRRAADRALVRQLREELFAGSPHLRPRLGAAGYEPFRFRGARDLADLPTSDLASLRGTAPEALVLRPSPRAMKELWPFGRKLALVLAGGRAAGLLEESYQPVLATEEDGLAVTWTRTDLALAGELGARLLDLCGVERGPLTLRLGDTPSFARLVLSEGAQRLGLELGEGAEIVALPAADASGIDARHVIALGLPSADRPQACSLWTSGPARVAAVHVPGDDGLRFFPDLVAAECVDEDTLAPADEGEVVLTNLGAHGTALLRYRAGLRARVDWTPRPPFGALPRLIPTPAA